MREAHVQVFWTDVTTLADCTIARCHDVLTNSERARAARQRSVHGRRQATVAYGGLKALLGGVLEDDPRAIRISRDEDGRPFLRSHANAVDFNLSHAGDLIVWVISHCGRVGVDIEMMGPGPTAGVPADLVLSSRELVAMSCIGAQQRPRALLRSWTRKEAILKASGVGLRRSPIGIEVPIDEGRPACGAREIGLVEGWSLFDLCLQPAYAGALATATPSPAIELRAVAWAPGPARSEDILSASMGSCELGSWA